METVGVRALKAQLSRYIAKAKAGETIIVTEHGQEVAELIPISKERRVIQHLATEHRLKWNGKKPRKVVLDAHFKIGWKTQDPVHATNRPRHLQGRST